MQRADLRDLAFLEEPVVDQVVERGGCAAGAWGPRNPAGLQPKLRFLATLRIRRAILIDDVMTRGAYSRGGAHYPGARHNAARPQDGMP